jgi:double-stranded uracil-DNA glycosylase
VGHYYAGRGNRFWRTIHEVGLTPRLYKPHEFPSLLSLGFGFTDLCKSGAGMDHQIVHHLIDVEGLRSKVRRFRPRSIAFTSKKAASYFYEKPTTAISLGHQRSEPDFPETFVLSSPSGAASRYWTADPWRELADWIKTNGLAGPLGAN